MRTVTPVVVGIVAAALLGLGGFALFHMRSEVELAAPVENRIIGIVVSTGTDSLTVAILQYDGPTPTDGGTKIFAVGPEAKVWRQEPRDFAVFQREYALFTEAIAAGTTTPMQAPLAYREVLLSLDDIPANAGVILTPVEGNPSVAAEVLILEPSQSTQPPPVAPVQ